ncbi:aldo/keto reductase [Pontibacter ramchanderi]|uniref:Diketogulonate reductase-like aldo/keto reductase n=1 Tax=Pontibacter ramchanderi TaxID=1179743 RepID=A0A2N3UDJ8_9BACT|nr:aldo/keto reductase [Pontibacter ramchanderi]PKV67444.1 diketogulonate reductase-like aldo/keto reductase [Pontibacter ramchanderi]
MKQIKIKGATIPALGLGTFQLENELARQITAAAISTGYRHIDTAQVYQNEDGVGSAIKNAGIARDEIFLTTKVFRESLAKKDFLPSVEESLRKLKTDYVDLLLIHWPNRNVAVNEYMDQLMEAQRKGYTKYIGVSNHPTALLDQVLATGADIITNQVEYHPLIDQTKLYTYLREHGISLTAYSPIAQGKVLGNPTLKSIGEQYSKSEVQVSLRWLLQQDGVMAIPRTSKAERLKDNLNIFDFELSAEDMARIDALKKDNQRVVNPPFAPDWD